MYRHDESFSPRSLSDWPLDQHESHRLFCLKLRTSEAFPASMSEQGNKNFNGALMQFDESFKNGYLRKEALRTTL